MPGTVILVTYTYTCNYMCRGETDGGVISGFHTYPGRVQAVGQEVDGVFRSGLGNFRHGG